jgi:dTDP-4-amino-4,6-dideoxygalactose transaminase
MQIPFNQPYLTGKELRFISEAHSRGQLAGDGHFTALCSEWIEKTTGCYKALLTHSCTAALEMAALLTNVQPGDEIIMPSYTFVSTANAFVLRGGVPVFVDIRADTLNIDESLIEAAITSKTKAIVVVHYAGVACEMDLIMTIASNYGLVVIEDAAQAVNAEYKGRQLGTIGDLGCYSFHETKNITCGEGGALLINNSDLFERAQIIREKGTNRSLFFRGQVDKYTWVDIGSSYLPGEMAAAFLWAQMQEVDYITCERLKLWSCYHASFVGLEGEKKLRRPIIPDHVSHNGHMYYLLLQDLGYRTEFIRRMKHAGINCVFHYIPLHSSPYGFNCGRASGKLLVTDDMANRLVRLPLWIGLDENHLTKIVTSIENIFHS